MDPTLWWLLAVVLVLTGIAGTVLPILPGTLLVFAGLFLAAWVDDYSKVGWLTLGGIGVLALLAWVSDYAAAALGAKRTKASGLAVWGAAIGTLVGLAAGVIGVLVAPFIGAALGEWIARTFGQPQPQSDALNNAMRVGFATGIALVVALAFKLAATFAMIGIFAVAYFW